VKINRVAMDAASQNVEKTEGKVVASKRKLKDAPVEVIKAKKSR
jgi:hypothetical protein